jgi:outer membrane protein assembly factor BamD
MKNSLIVITLLLLIAGCSPYQRALKSEDSAVKIAMIDTLMKKGKYGKTILLFDQIIPKYRGTDSAATMAIKYAKSLYEDENYPTSANQYERFVTSHPTHPDRELATFMAAKSHYRMSTIYSKDQRDTQIALVKLQDYINLFPSGEYSNEANTLVNELRTKLDKKAFEISRNYHHRERYIPAIESFDNFIIDHPGSEYQDDAHFYLLDSQYQYAILSLEIIVEERLELAKKYYDTFAKRFPTSEYMEEAQEIMKNIEAYKPI